MKRFAALLFTGLLFLAACSGEQEPGIWTPSPAAPATPPPTPSALQGQWWESLSPEELPSQVSALEDLSLLGPEEAARLGETPDAVLYGLGGGEGILLERGGSLFYFPQCWHPSGLPALPYLFQSDLDADGADELAVRYLMQAEEDRILYDLHIYDWEGSDCADCPITSEACAALAEAQVETSYSPSTGVFTLTCGRDSVTYQLPEPLRAGTVSLVLDTCFFREGKNGFTAVLGARVTPSETRFANLLAEIGYSGGTFTLHDIRLEPTTEV